MFICIKVVNTVDLAVVVSTYYLDNNHMYNSPEDNCHNSFEYVKVNSSHYKHHPVQTGGIKIAKITYLTHKI